MSAAHPMNHAPIESPLRHRFEEHELTNYTRARLLQRGPEDRYADAVTQARWEFWQAAQPPALDLTSARAYLDTLRERAVFSKDRTAILKAAQHLMRCIRNDNPEFF